MSHSPDPIPAPTPALRHQHNGWTPERQRIFLDTLAATGSVRGAARSAGMSKQSAYRLRHHPAGGHFAAEWDAALADAGRLVEDLLLERLVEGEEEVIERDGVTVAVRRRPCDPRLLLYHLKRLEDRRIAINNSRQNPPDGAQVAKLRAELRALMEDANAEAAAEAELAARQPTFSFGSGFSFGS